MGLQLSAGTLARKKRRLNIAAIPDCEWWIDCSRPDTMSFISGTSVSQVRDLSGKNRHMTKAGAGNETIYPTYVPAEKSLLFLNSAFDQMIAGSADTWNFLHNGTGCTILVMAKIDAAQSANGVILSTSSEASSGIGTNIWYQNAAQNYNVTTRNGTAQSFYSSGPADSFQKNTTKILSVHIESRAGNPSDLVTRFNGATDIQTNIISALSNSNSTGALYVGKLADGVFKPKFHFKKCAIFSRRLGKAEENMILQEWAREENIALTTYPDVPLVVLAGQSNAKGRGVIADTGFQSAPSVANASIFNTSGFSWAALQAGVNNSGYDANTLGIEMALAKSWTTRTGKPFFLVKHTVDGTPITSWASSNNNFINLQSAMQRAWWKLEDMGHVPKPCFIWQQGESDALDIDLATAYEAKLGEFLDGITDLNGFRQAKRFIVHLHQSPAAIGTTAIRQAQLHYTVTLPQSRYTELVIVDDIAEHIDQHHLTAASLCALGERIADRIV